MSTPIVIPVILEACVVKKDKSASIRFTTALELRAKENAEFFENMHQAGVLYFRAGEEDKAQIEALDEIDLDLGDKSKTPSKRLRNVLYKVWEMGDDKHGGYGTKTFKDWYTEQMEVLINHFKKKLDEEI